jgi:2,3-dihydroxybenzoate decarboxylase/5-carboxyvanillate decarboxylase
MPLDRRTLLGGSSALMASAALSGAARGAAGEAAAGRFRRIATEEACTTQDVVKAMCDLSRGPSLSLDMGLVRGTYVPKPPTRWLSQLLDIEGERLQLMDAANVDVHLLSLSSPGVQMFDADLACSLATAANDQMADHVRRRPNRFAMLASFAPQSPERAAKEMQRVVAAHQVAGFIVNSHTFNEYLDDPKFWPIFEAAEALDRPIYLHPRQPSEGMAAPFVEYSMSSALWGFAVETGTHALRLILSGVFERFPRLQVVLGHMGEGLPYYLTRIDHWYPILFREGRVPKLRMRPSDYFRRNCFITTSGMESNEVLQFCLAVLGADRILWAIDYPFEEMAPAVRFLDAAPIGDSDKAKIYHQNAERIFHIAV